MKVKNSLLIIFIWITSSCATKVVGIYNHAVVINNPQSYLIQPANENATLSADNKKLDSELQEIITKSLENRGLNSSAIPDLYVSYLISTYTSSETQQNNYNTNYNYMNPYPYNYSTRNYKEGLMVIDIKNHNGKLIWQGSKSFKVRSKHTVREILPEICREIIDSYSLAPENIN